MNVSLPYYFHIMSVNNSMLYGQTINNNGAMNIIMREKIYGPKKVASLKHVSFLLRRWAKYLLGYLELG